MKMGTETYQSLCNQSKTNIKETFIMLKCCFIDIFKNLYLCMCSCMCTHVQACADGPFLRAHAQSRSHCGNPRCRRLSNTDPQFQGSFFLCSNPFLQLLKILCRFSVDRTHVYGCFVCVPMCTRREHRTHYRQLEDAMWVLGPEFSLNS